MKTLVTLGTLCAATIAVNAATITTSYSTVSGADDNNQAGPNFGQSIIVNVGADTADASIPSNVYLNELSFQTSSSGVGAGSGAAYIHVYDDFIIDGSSTPLVIGNLVAVSTSTVDLANTANNSQVTWAFSGNDAINKAQPYYYVLATNTTAATALDSSNLTAAGFELDTGDPYTGGQAYRANGTTTDWDMAFELKTSTDPVPEPSSTALLGLGGLALILRRRK